MKFSDLSFNIKTNGEEIDIVKNRWIEGGALIAIASNKSLWKEIDVEYQKCEKEAILSYTNSDFYELPILKTLTTPVRAMTIKTFSLYSLYEKKDQASKWLQDIANKGYKRFVDYIKQNERNFSWEGFFNYLEKRNPELSAIEHDNLMLLMFTLFGEDLFPTFHTNFGRNLLHNVYQNNRIMGARDENFLKEKESEKMKALRSLQETIHMKIPNSVKIDTLFQENESYLIKNELTSAERHTVATTGNYDVLYRKGLLRYYKPLTGILREHNLNDFSFASLANVNRSDLVGVYVMFQNGIRNGRLKEEEWELYLTASILLTMMVNHYKELSTFYFDTVKKQEELILKEESLSTGQKEWEIEKQEMLKQEKERLKKEERKDTYISELEEKVKALEKSQEETHALKQEVSALRNYAYSKREVPEETHTSQEPNTVEKVTALLQDKKAVLFGGHPQLVNKLKDSLSDIEYRDVDTLNRDLSFLVNMDIVFLMTNYFNHPFYYKLMKELEKAPNVRLVYLSGYPNLGRTLNEMIELIEA